jgi:cell division transport system permease protein
MSAGTWAARHVQALLSSAGHLSRKPVATLFTVMVMALALSLPLALGVLVQNVQAVTGNFSDAIGLSVYLKTGTAEQRARQLVTAASSQHSVERATLVTSAEALKEFRADSGFGAALDALDDNPLPHLIAIRPKSDASPDEIETLRRYLVAWPEVDTVQLDSDWVRRYTAIMGVLHTLLIVAVVLLGAGVVAVVGNTIRLEILNRRAEIEVTKLVGGSNAFVRRPFLYTGALYGVMAGLMGWALVTGSLVLLARPVARLAAAYGSRFELADPALREFGVLLLGGALLGWIGAWLAASRELSRIEPTAG